MINYKDIGMYINKTVSRCFFDLGTDVGKE
ncbi:Uncharacterised protein [Sphingobacterium thalpophilum]|uniref:Uncharacterized protein n=1 Tax=Sphingobacterium thalpophilum TaxID=259 RepID=A0A4U9VRU6_9SPHI|nr:Uncharacterised protein [Sphingobacterium thalpophilum]